jgi:hypothetical protein
MEILFLILIIFGPLAWNLLTDSSSSTPDTTYYREPSMPELQCRLVNDTFEIDGDSHATVRFEMKGKIPPKVGVGIFVHLETADGLVRAVVPDCQEFSSLTFQHTSTQIVHNPEGDKYWPDWVSTGGAPIALLVAPKGGRQSCRLRISFCSCEYRENDGWIPPTFRNGLVTKGSHPIRVLESGWIQVSFDETGFLELDLKRSRWAEATVKLAFCMAAIDGFVDEDEVAIVKAWCRKMTSSVEDSGDLRVKLERAIEVASKPGFKVNIDQIFAALEGAPSGIRFEAAELITEVLAADGKATEAELDLRDTAVGRLSLDVQECRALLDKKLATDGLEFGEESNPFRALGIPANASTEESRKMLKDEFRKWNGRTTHPNPDVRDRAVAMLNLISEARLALETTHSL